MDFLGIFELGLIFSIFILGMLLSFRILGFADLTIEGSFVTGGAIFAIMINYGINPFIATFLSMIGGGLAGYITASLHCYLGINRLLSGIITLTLLYTGNLRIMGRSNISLDGKTTLLNFIDFQNFDFCILIIIFVLSFSFVITLLSTNLGLFLRATGENELFVKNIRVNPKKLIIIGLILSNMLIALSGCLFAQSVGYNDIGNGQGMLVSMLTAMIIGENLIKPITVNKQVASCFIGAIIFQFLYSLALKIGVKPVDLKLIIGAILILFLLLTKFSNKDSQNKNIGANFI